MPRLALADTELHYELHRDAGADREATPVVLSMGLGFDGGAWAPQVEALRQDRTVITFDARGTGRSARSRRGDYRIRTLASDLVALLDHLEVERAHLVGQSMGGAVVLSAALAAPQRAARLALIATAARFRPAPLRLSARLALRMGTDWVVSGARREEVPAKVAEAWLPYLCPSASEPAVERLFLDEVERATRSAIRPDVFAAQLLGLLRVDLRPRLGELDHPALVIGGDADVLVDPMDTEALAAGLPRGTLSVVAGAGHGLNLCRAGEVNLLLRRFFVDGDEAGRPAA